MTHCAGLDVSVNETAICVNDAGGAVVWQGKVSTRIEAIADALAHHAPELERAGMETGPVAVWLWHGLRNVNVLWIAFMRVGLRRPSNFRSTRPTGTMPAAWRNWCDRVGMSPFP